ncbi:ABC transporter [Anoxybacter fermentans]|uniref:Transport permease protein n=1 Tax=Anoxybacter fermentans TaxID=1323375 RepID=A0A3S9SXW9_9FIRM|nr:ABC transporter permease [Anoxybacter fermentans]AZR73100.1 ABC transporter [Anoxybacter fermentans]
MRLAGELVREFKASFAFVERNFYLTKRYLGWEIVFLSYSTVNALTIGLIGVTQSSEMVMYLVIGALFWSFLGNIFMIVSESVAWERWEGTIEYTFMAPIRRLTHLGGMCLFGIIYGVVRTIIMITILSIFLDFDFGRANIFSALLVLLISSFAFIGLGLIAAVLPLISPERGPQATNIIQALILLISGVYYPISVLPEWLQIFSRLSPGTYALQAARKALLKGAQITELKSELIIIAVIGVILIPLGLWVFNLAEKWAMRAGKLKRSG